MKKQKSSRHESKIVSAAFIAFEFKDSIPGGNIAEKNTDIVFGIQMDAIARALSGD